MVLGPQRDLFEVPDGVAYLDCAKMSANLRSVRAAGEAGVARKSAPWALGAPEFFDESEQLRGLFADLIGGDQDGVAIIPAASYGISTAARNLPLAAGQRILVLAEQFPSNVYPWRAVAERVGAVVDVVPRSPDGWSAGVLARLDDDVAAVAVPQCHWTDGTFVDLMALRAGTEQIGAALVVDATQALGAYPLDVGTLRPDFLVSAAYKWLLGPYSVAFMWAAPRWRDGEPLEWNWITRAGSENFAGLVDYGDAFAPGARRYDVGERSNFALLPMAVAALQQLLAWGVGEIQETIAALTARIESDTRGLGLDPVPTADRVGHIIGVRLPEGVPDGFMEQLVRADVHVSLRGDSVRISPHLWNTPEDLDRLLEHLEGASSS